MSLKNSLKTLVVLLLLIIPALYYGLGARPIYKIQEVRIAETARGMVTSGDWLVPRYNGELRLQKPPLPYWLTAASYRLFGINEMAVRLPALLFGVLTALLLFAWAKRELGMQIAANTVLVLITSYIGLRYFRSGEADAALIFFISAATLLGYRILQGEASNRQQLLFYATLGLGFLTKGPAAIAVPVLTVILFAFQQKRLAALKSWPNPAWLNLLGLIVFMLLAFGWYAWILGYMPDAAQYFMGKQVDETFISGTHAKPFWWYLAHITEFYAPWIIADSDERLVLQAQTFACANAVCASLAGGCIHTADIHSQQTDAICLVVCTANRDFAWPLSGACQRWICAI